MARSESYDVVSRDEAGARENVRIVCRCEEVSRGEIIEAIRGGAITLNDIKRRTRAGMGLCQGKACCRLIQRILAQETGRGVEEILPFRHRPPVRPIPLQTLASLDER